MKIFECKCGSKEIFIEESGNNKGLYCADCGKWIQWLGKDDLRLAQRQTKYVSKIDLDETEYDRGYQEGRADAIKECIDVLKGIDTYVADMVEDIFKLQEEYKEQKNE